MKFGRNRTFCESLWHMESKYVFYFKIHINTTKMLNVGLLFYFIALDLCYKTLGGGESIILNNVKWIGWKIVGLFRQFDCMRCISVFYSIACGGGGVNILADHPTHSSGTVHGYL